MTIKIRFQPDQKAIIRWKTPMEREFLKQQMTMFRDLTTVTPINLKDEKGREIPRLSKPKPQMPIMNGGMVASGEYRQITHGNILPATVASGEVMSIASGLDHYPEMLALASQPQEPVVVKLDKPEEKKDVERPA